MNMYNLIEYSDNYADTTASLYQFKRQEQNRNNDGNIIDLTTASSSFKYQFKKFTDCCVFKIYK